MNDAWIAALKARDLESVKQQLEEDPSLVTQTDKRLDTDHDRCQFALLPLRWAVTHNMRDIADALLHAGADVNANDPYGNMLQAADTLEMVDFLVGHGAHVNGPGYDTGNAVILASYNAQVEKLERLVSYGADVNRPALNDGRTGLHVAAGWGFQGEPSLDVIRVLLQHGADVNIRDKKNQTPLHWAVQPSRKRGTQGNKDVVALLLLHGADVTIRDMDGKAPLDYSVSDEISTLLT